MATSQEFQTKLKNGNIIEAMKLALADMIELNICTRVVPAEEGESQDDRPGHQMRTRINIVDGDIETEVGSLFLNDGPYAELRSLHTEQVIQGRDIIRSNIESLQTLLGICVQLLGQKDPQAPGSRTGTTNPSLDGTSPQAQDTNPMVGIALGAGVAAIGTGLVAQQMTTPASVASDAEAYAPEPPSPTIAPLHLHSEEEDPEGFAVLDGAGDMEENEPSFGYGDGALLGELDAAQTTTPSPATNDDLLGTLAYETFDGGSPTDLGDNLSPADFASDDVEMTGPEGTDLAGDDLNVFPPESQGDEGDVDMSPLDLGSEVTEPIPDAFRVDDLGADDDLDSSIFDTDDSGSEDFGTSSFSANDLASDDLGLEDDLGSDDSGSEDFGTSAFSANDLASDDLGLEDDLGSDDLGANAFGSEDLDTEDLGTADLGTDDLGSGDLASETTDEFREDVDLSIFDGDDVDSIEGLDALEIPDNVPDPLAGLAFGTIAPSSSPSTTDVQDVTVLESPATSNPEPDDLAFDLGDDQSDLEEVADQAEEQFFLETGSDEPFDFSGSSPSDDREETEDDLRYIDTPDLEAEDLGMDSPSDPPLEPDSFDPALDEEEDRTDLDAGEPLDSLDTDSDSAFDLSPDLEDDSNEPFDLPMDGGMDLGTPEDDLKATHAESFDVTPDPVDTLDPNEAFDFTLNTDDDSLDLSESADEEPFDFSASAEDNLDTSNDQSFDFAMDTEDSDESLSVADPEDSLDLTNAENPEPFDFAMDTGDNLELSGDESLGFGNQMGADLGDLESEPFDFSIGTEDALEAGGDEPFSFDMGDESLVAEDPADSLDLTNAENPEPFDFAMDTGDNLEISGDESLGFGNQMGSDLGDLESEPFDFSTGTEDTFEAGGDEPFDFSMGIQGDDPLDTGDLGLEMPSDDGNNYDAGIWDQGSDNLMASPEDELELDMDWTGGDNTASAESDGFDEFDDLALLPNEVKSGRPSADEDTGFGDAMGVADVDAMDSLFQGSDESFDLGEFETPAFASAADELDPFNLDEDPFDQVDQGVEDPFDLSFDDTPPLPPPPPPRQR